jgi:CHAT domain
MGARAVIAPGWAVDDKAGQAFAQAFYEEMFAPNPFAEAVVRARERIFAAYPGVNTWGAYQCDGDPAFALMKVTPESKSQAPVSESEIVILAEQVARNARAADEDERRELLRHERHGQDSGGHGTKPPNACRSSKTPG